MGDTDRVGILIRSDTDRIGGGGVRGGGVRNEVWGEGAAWEGGERATGVWEREDEGEKNERVALRSQSQDAASGHITAASSPSVRHRRTNGEVSGPWARQGGGVARMRAPPTSTGGLPTTAVRGTPNAEGAGAAAEAARWTAGLRRDQTRWTAGGGERWRRR